MEKLHAFALHGFDWSLNLCCLASFYQGHYKFPGLSGFLALLEELKNVYFNFFCYF